MQVTSVVTPRVTSAVREHFQCNTLAGAELEDDGGDGTAGSHWEQRLFEGVQPPCRPADSWLKSVNFLTLHSFAPFTLPGFDALH